MGKLSESHVCLRIPAALEAITGATGPFQIQGGSIREILIAFAKMFPDAGALVCTTDGNPHRFANVYVNGTDYRLAGDLDSKLREGTSLRVVTSMAGG